MTEILTTLLQHYAKKTDKADIFLKYQLKRYRNVGKTERNLLYEAFYAYLRSRTLIEFFSPSNQIEDLTQTALTYAQRGVEGLNNLKVQQWHTLSPTQQNNLRHSYPPFWQEQIEASFSSNEWDEVKAYLNGRAGVSLLNLERRQPCTLLQNYLQQKGLKVTKGHLSPYTLRVEGKLPKEDETPLFDPQDEGSALTALLINPNSKTCLDFCAGAGGKSVAMGTFWPNLKITASDIRQNLKENTLQRAKRAGIKLRWRNKNELNDGYDTVFLDAPCSGSGVWRRNPEDRYRIDNLKQQSLIESQRNLLLEAGKYVKKGGELIYVTCSFSTRENEENINWFLTKTKSFKLLNATQRLSQNLGYLGIENSQQLVLSYYQEGSFFKNKLSLQADLFFGAVFAKI